MSAEDEKKTAAGLTRAVDLLCQASGVADWTGEKICPVLDGIKESTGRVGRNKWPIETSAETLRALSM
jgi:hypothetical protein